MDTMLEIQKQRLKLSHISKKLNMTVTETSRHLQRLSEVKLVQKDVEGLYGLTSLGELTLSMLSGLNFVSQNSQYFLEHDASILPYEFLNRIGELTESSFQNDIISSFAYEEGIFREAVEYIWAMADQVHWSAPPIITEKIKEGVELRAILPSDIVPPKGYRPVDGVERRILKKVDLNIIVTEKEATFSLPFLNEKIDYSQFVSKDEKFIKWCHDLFLYYWERAKSIISFPNLR
jgi:predicted transcriptional regulator